MSAQSGGAAPGAGQIVGGQQGGAAFRVNSRACGCWSSGWPDHAAAAVDGLQEGEGVGQLFASWKAPTAWLMLGRLLSTCRRWLTSSKRCSPALGADCADARHGPGRRLRTWTTCCVRTATVFDRRRRDLVSKRRGNRCRVTALKTLRFFAQLPKNLEPLSKRLLVYYLLSTANTLRRSVAEAGTQGRVWRVGADSEQG